MGGVGASPDEAMLSMFGRFGVARVEVLCLMIMNIW